MKARVDVADNWTQELLVCSRIAPPWAVIRGVGRYRVSTIRKKTLECAGAEGAG